MKKKKEQPSFDKGRLCELIMTAKSVVEEKKENERKERLEMQKSIVEKNVKLADELRALWHDFVSQHQKDLTDIFEVSKCLFENLGCRYENTECFCDKEVKGLDSSFLMDLTIRCKEEESDDTQFIDPQAIATGHPCKLLTKKRDEIPENDYFIAKCNMKRGILFMFSPTDTENNIFLSEELYSLEEYLNKIITSDNPSVANTDLVETTLMFKALFIAIESYKKNLERDIVDLYKRANKCDELQYM